MKPTRVQVSVHEPDGVTIGAVVDDDSHSWTALHLNDYDVRLTLFAAPTEVVALLRRLADDVEARAGVVTA